MDSIIKFRVKTTITPGMEKEMADFIELLKNDFEASIKSEYDTFYTEYHLTTSWKHHVKVIELIEEKLIGRPYLIYPIK